jgi:hypothetical protein
MLNLFFNIASKISMNNKLQYFKYTLRGTQFFLPEEIGFYDTYKTINSNHFVLLKSLENEYEKQFWTDEIFGVLLKQKIQNLNTKQGGKILLSAFKKLTLYNSQKEEHFLLAIIIFEKRFNLTNPNLFSFSHYDKTLDKTLAFENYNFLKIKKNKVIPFLNTLEKRKTYFKI